MGQLLLKFLGRVLEQIVFRSRGGFEEFSVGEPGQPRPLARG